MHSAPETQTFLLLSNPARIGDIRLYLVGINLQTKTECSSRQCAAYQNWHKSFVSKNVILSEEAGLPAFLVKIVPRLGSQATCSGCDKKRPGYDTLPERRFEFVPLWGIAVFFLYAMRRVNCPGCGIVVEPVPWGNGKQTLTTTYSLYLTRWAKRLNWKETAEAFQTSWDKVFAAVSVAVEWGLAHRDLSSVTAIGVEKLKAQGNEVLTNSRWSLLKRPENLTERQEAKLAQLEERGNLATYRAYLLKESFQSFWEYVSPAWAGKFLDRWCNRTMRSRIEPMKKMAKQLRNHRPLILNWFKARGSISLGDVEGLNNRLKLTFRKSYEFRTLKCTKIALYHTMGDLPEPPETHRFL